MRKLFTFITLAAVLLSCKAPSNNSALENEIQSIITKNNAIGLAVVAVNKGEVIYSNTFGYKNLEEKTPLQKDDIFRIASISKSFTALGIMQLVEEGKLSLDAKVSDIIGFKVENPKYKETPITIEMLLSHSSSLNDSNGYFTLNAMNPDSSKTWESAYNNYQPGSKYEYCNLGYNTLGTIIEIVSGERFDKYIVNNILNKIGVYGGYEVSSLDSNKFVNIYEYNSADSSFTHSPAAYAKRLKEIENYTFGKSTPIFSPTGGLKISAQDLAKVMIMHMNLGKTPCCANGDSISIISKESALKMQSKLISPTDEGDAYGYAIRTTEQLLDGFTMIGHTGGAYGVFTSMFWDKDREFGFVVMTNGCNGRRDHNFMSIHREVNAALYNNLIKR